MIEARGLVKRYGPTIAVDHLSFDVRPGTVTGFLGPNGAGKTTTMRLLCGLDRPDAGTATIDGHPYARLTQPGRRVGVMLDPGAMHRGRTGRETLALAALVLGVGRERVARVLELVGLDAAAAAKRVGEYSLGMQQRLALGVALLGDPGILVLDEPANGLDPQGIRWLRDFLRAMAAEGRTVLVSSHVLAEVAQTVDDVVVIHRGRLVQQGPVQSLTAAGAGVLVRTPRPDVLRTALDRAGLTAVEAPDGALVVDGGEAAQVGEIAFAAGVPLHELAPRSTSLEEAFLALTTDAPPEVGP